MRSRLRLVIAAATGVLVAACAGGGSIPTAVPASTASPTISVPPASTTALSASTAGPTTTALPAPTEAPENLPSPPSGRGENERTVTVSGTLESGVEPRCVLLDGYLLLGGPRELLKPGQTLSVTGRVSSTVVTTCQQGTPLQVDRAVLMTPGGPTK